MELNFKSGFVLLLLSNLLAFTTSQSEMNWDKFNWIPSDALDTYYNRLTPISNDGRVTRYLCRARYRNNLVQGKLTIGGDNPCFTVIAGEIITLSNWEVLIFPQNSLDWMPTVGDIPEDAISFGTLPDTLEESYGCRINNGGTGDNANQTYFGFVSRSVGICNVDVGGTDIMTNRKFEALVLSSSGKIRKLAERMYKI